MVSVSGFVGSLIGFPLGITLFVTDQGQLFEQPRLQRLMAVIINATRSIPFIILLVLLIPFTRLVVGTSIGTTAALVPLSLGAAPFVARIVEAAIREVPKGLVDAGFCMGATHVQVIWRILLREALPNLLRGITITLVSLVGYSAMAGVIGGGGLGDVAVRYGYQRFNTPVMLVTTALLVVFVQTIQSTGDWAANKLDRR